MAKEVEGRAAVGDGGWGVTQTIVGEKDGNCLEAAIATILGCELSDVPKLTDHTWNTQLTDWFFTRGITWTTCDADKPPAGLSVAVGPSPRRSVSHAVVAVNGKLAWDPHPDRTFFGDGKPKYFIELERDAAVGDGGHTEAVREALTKLADDLKTSAYAGLGAPEDDVLAWMEDNYPAAALSAMPREQEDDDA